MRLSIAVIVLTALSLRADFIAPTAANFGWERPTVVGGTATFQAWETFASLAGPNAPQTVFGTGTPASTVTYTPPATNNQAFGGDAGTIWNTINPGVPNVSITGTGTFFLTSGGNIYSPTDLVAPRIVIPNNIDGVTGSNPNGSTTLLLQLRLLGETFNPVTMRLDDTIEPTSATLLAMTSLGGFGGTLRDYAIRFDVPGNADQYTISFTATGPSMSLDRIAVDTNWNATAVPEPALALLLLAFLWRKS